MELLDGVGEAAAGVASAWPPGCVSNGQPDCEEGTTVHITFFQASSSFAFCEDRALS